MKNLNELCVQEMDAKELKQTDGGNPFIGPVIMLAIYLFDNRDRFIEGVKDGINDFKL